MQVPLKKIYYKLILILITTNWTNNYVQLTQLTFCSCWETQDKWKKNGSCWLKNSFDFIIIYICYMFAAPKRIKNAALVIMMSQHWLHNWRCFHDKDILKRLYTVLRYISKFSVQTILSSLAIVSKSLNFNMYILFVKLYFLPSVKLLHGVNHEEHQRIIIVCPWNFEIFYDKISRVICLLIFNSIDLIKVIHPFCGYRYNNLY